MFKRLSLTLVIILLISMCVTAGVALNEIHVSLRERFKNTLKLSAIWLREEWPEDEAPDDAAARLREIVQKEFELPLRITIIRPDGKVSYDNEADVANMNQHDQRPEVLAVLDGQDFAENVRFSVSTGQDMMYGAIMDETHDAVIRLSLPLPLREQVFLRFSSKILWVLVFFLFFSVGAAAFLTRRYTRPLDALCHEATRMGEGDYSARIPASNGKDFREIRQLSTAFNEMADSLQAQQLEMEDKNARLNAILNAMMDPLLLVDRGHCLRYVNEEAKSVFGRSIDPEEHAYPQLLLTHSDEIDEWVSRSIQEEKDLETRLSVKTIDGERHFRSQFSPISVGGQVLGVVVALHDLSAEEEAAIYRRDFAANVSHELKTPLTSIRGFLETLRSGENLPQETRQRFYEIMDVESIRLENLINDILSLSEIEQGEVKQKESFDLREVVDEVLVLLDDKASARKAVLLSDPVDEPLPVSADRDHIKQILINLIDNAIKYGREGGRVMVSTHRDEEDQVAIEVTDDGPGIPYENQKRIFERFYRVDKGRSRELGGTGLGLSIVKHLAQLYHGEATLSSVPGQGSSFKVTLEI